MAYKVLPKGTGTELLEDLIAKCLSLIVQGVFLGIGFKLVNLFL